MMRFKPGNFMLLPTMACQAECSYCFAEKTGETMSATVVDKTIDFIERIAPKKGHLNITFHGGEPLLAEKGYYEYILPMLRKRFGRRLRLSMQSNLWALDDRMISLIKEYEIAMGTSVDGDEAMCDAQRGEGYFQKTYKAMSRLRNEGVSVGEICTFTSYSANCARRVFGVFPKDSVIAALPYSIHGAVPVLDYPRAPFALNVEEMAQVFLDTLDMYRNNISRRHIGTIDAMARGCIERKGSICTFFDCLGHFAVIAPDGRVYSCQRFCGYDDFSLGSVLEDLDEMQILESEACRRLLSKQNGTEAACGDCAHYDYCKGGCLYNMFTALTQKDPYCEAYRAVFDEISTGMALEMGGIMTGKITERQAPMLAMAGDVPHPHDCLVNEINMRLALRYATPERGGYLAKHKHKEFPENHYNKLYLHITFDCPLRCDHCYAEGGERDMPEMGTENTVYAARAAAKARFKSVVVTGGEPLIHNEIDQILDSLSDVDMTGTKLILHTSLGFDIPAKRLKKVCDTFDEIIVSIDGDRDSHDKRRGSGRYDITLNNLKLVKELGLIEKLGICATLPKAMRDGREGEAVVLLCKELGITNIRFRSILPLGRAEGMKGEESSFSCADESNLNRPFHPRFTCGLGKNLYIEPDGNAYPCYAWCGKDKLLGNIKAGLPAILESDGFCEFRWHDVDTNKKCRDCAVRYLCGGMCKAWARNKENIDSGDFDCTARMAYFEQMASLIEM